MKKRSISTKMNEDDEENSKEETTTEVCTSACLSVWDSILLLDQRFTTHLAVCATKESPLGHLRPLMKILEISCHGIPWIFGTVVFFLCSHKAQNITVSVNMMFALLFDLVIVGLLKMTFRRSRPSHNVSDMFAAPGVDKFSFPSGHSTRAFLMAFFVSFQVIANRLLMLVVFVWAIAVCLSRILLGRHHILDVVCGIIVGIASYFAVLRLWLSEEMCMNYLDTYFGHVHL